MEYPLEYIDFLAHFHGDRDYFECHEILEEYWKEVDSKNKHSIWVGFIQLAVANYHHRRGNFNGALRTLQKSLHIFTLNEVTLFNLGIDPVLLFKQMKQQLLNIEHHHDYQSTNLPIYSKELIKNCINRSEALQVGWCNESDLNNLEIVHRHLRRDRTQVIRERNQAKQIKGSDL